MPEIYTRTMLLDIMRESLHEIGYHDSLLRQEYNFVDVSKNNYPKRKVDLAAFAQEPPSYRNSCFGVVTTSHEDPESITDFMALGAPQIFSLDVEHQEIFRWKILARGEPQLIGQIKPDQLRTTILSHKNEWNPDTILRAKSLGFANEVRQLDFFDAGLIPVLENFVHTKLDKVLRDALASSELVYNEHHEEKIDHNALFRLIFRLIAAKLLGDRDHPGDWLNRDVRKVIKSVENFYSIPTENVLDDINVQTNAWNKIRSAFSFQNLSVEALAYVYENTLVSTETRKAYGTHATPHVIAEYILQELPINKISETERYVFEPFAGHAPFLVAALGRLRSLLHADISIEQRHEYFVEMLAGLELDAFACEVARYSLILADYPNPNGWRIEKANFFKSPNLDTYLNQAQIVLCNPPYEEFTFDERESYSYSYSPNKAVEALNLVLSYQPRMLGFVLPRAFVDGRMYSKARKKIAELYDNISLLGLPDNAFNFSEAEAVLLVAHGKRTSQPVWKFASLTKADYKKFPYTGKPTWQVIAPNSFVEDGINSDNPIFWYTPMQSVWDAMEHLPRLEDFIDIHRGIEYNIPFQENKQNLVSSVPKAGFVKGLDHVTDDFEPFLETPTAYLDFDSGKMRGNAYLHPWHEPKVIANAVRLSRGAWTISAVVDSEGLVCYQNFHGIWSKGQLPLEVIAALLNGPVANAYLTTHNTSKHNKVQTIKQIPVPKFRNSQIHLIVSLVREYMSYRSQWLNDPHRSRYFEQRCGGVMKRIDSEILTAYDLAPGPEQSLVKYFDGHKRPGPIISTQIRSSPANRLYTSLIKVEDIKGENGNKIVGVIVMNWNPHQVVHIPASLVPKHIKEKLERDVWLMAYVNVGARKAEDLFFENIELAPEPKPHDRLS